MILSIVMPAYNAVGHMATTVLNVAPLIEDDAELIFVDDGSTDGTADLFLSLQRSAGLANSTLVRQAHGGVSEARNRGLSAAKGDYVLFLDSDDLVSHELLCELRILISGCTPDVICWGWDTVSMTGEVIRNYFDVHPRLPAQMTGEEALYRRTVDRSLRIWTGSAAYRRTYVTDRQLVFTLGCSVGEDLEFSYLALLGARKVAFLPRVLSTYRKRPGSVTSVPSLSRFDSVVALKRVQDKLDVDGRPGTRLIADHFRRTKVLVNYFFTLESYLFGLSAWSPTSTLRSMDELFPELTVGIRSSVLRDNGALPIEWRLFARSPGCWWAWVQLRRRADRFLPVRFRSSGPVADRRRAALLAGGQPLT